MDSAGHLLLATHELYARAATEGRPKIYKVVGLLLAISSGLFIGVSFVLKKTGLLKANAKYNEEAGEGYGYLKNAYWWTGMTLMIIGEVCNFVAYAFVDAILVTPLGALSVVVTTILSAIFLKERLSFVGKVGCFNCIIGSVIIVINAPEQSAVATIQDMKRLVIAPGFLSYAGVIIVGCIFIALWVAPRYGKKSMMVYLTICSLIGGLSVVATQGLGAAIVTQIGGTPQFNQWFLYVLLVFVVATLLTEIIYLNKALNLFNAALVTPTYYVFFTSSTIVTSAILFQGFKGTAATISTVIMGFLTICSGVVLLQLSKSAKDVPDAVVFAGDVDQVRTVAEQEEPEYEPRADTIRGGAALLRSISKVRQKKQNQEAEKLKQEHMQAIGENEPVVFDGIRRRRTTIESGGGSLSRRKTIHPPLGMSRFPDPADEDTEMHPGFLDHFRRRSRTNSRAVTPGAAADAPPVPLSPLKSSIRPDVRDRGVSNVSGVSSNSGNRPHVYGLPAGLTRPTGDMAEDTAYVSPSHSAIHWAPDAADEARSRSGTSSAPSAISPFPPAPLSPPHMAKRQFSFQNVFRKRSDSDNEPVRPSTARSTQSFTRRALGVGSGSGSRSGETEEERLGLVKGDSQTMLGHEEHDSELSHDTEPPLYTDHDGSQSQRATVRSVVGSRSDHLYDPPQRPGERQYSPVKRGSQSSDDAEGHGKSFM